MFIRSHTFPFLHCFIDFYLLILRLFRASVTQSSSWIGSNHVFNWTFSVCLGSVLHFRHFESDMLFISQFFSSMHLHEHWFFQHYQVLEDKPDLSQWTLKYDVFGRNVEFAWLARNLQVVTMSKKAIFTTFVDIFLLIVLFHRSQPIRNQKIHWRSLEGLPNKYVQSRGHYFHII